MKKYKNIIIIACVILAVLAFAFWWGGNAPGLSGWNVWDKPIPKGAVSSPVPEKISKQTAEVITPSPAAEKVEDSVKNPEPNIQKNAESIETDSLPKVNEPVETLPPKAENGNAEYSKNNGMVLDNSTGKDKYLTDPVPEGKPVPLEPQNTVIEDKELTCMLSVRCDSILNNISWLNPEKKEMIPKDGIILQTQTVTFYEGESVFNVLLREMKRNKIHMEFENTPIYNSAYIEGIHNIYEFDCGELSGWMYKVNDWFPNYGCSRYLLKPGDKVEWVYTCDLGVDVGGYYAAGGN